MPPSHSVATSAFSFSFLHDDPDAAAQIASSAIASAKTFFGNVANFFSIDWAFSIPSIPPGVIFVLIGVLAAIVMCTLCCSFTAGLRASASIDEIRQGPEAQTWVQIARKNKTRTRLMKYSLLAALALYLPVTRTCIDVFACR